MFRFYPEKFLFAFHSLLGMRSMIDRYPPGTKAMIQLSHTRELESGLRHLVEIFEKLQMPVSLTNAQAIIEMYEKRQERPLTDVSTLVALIWNSAINEFKGRLVVGVEPAQADFFDAKVPLFGPAVGQKFPNMSDDISEAGMCIALDRPTAAVFHLMRVVELGVQTFGTKLGVQLASELNWQRILDQINKAVRGLKPRDPQTKAYAGAAANLYHVKVAWRNEVMHPKQTYTREEALKVFNAVREFVQELAGIL